MYLKQFKSSSKDYRVLQLRTTINIPWFMILQFADLENGNLRSLVLDQGYVTQWQRLKATPQYHLFSLVI